jgi:hypothetical protein
MEAGLLLQKSIRLCSLASPLDTLTLARGLLEEPRRLYTLLRLVTRNAFLSRAMAATTAKHLAVPVTTSSHLMASSGAVTVALPEAPWMADRPQTDNISLGDLLVNRVELSLWGSYWRKVSIRSSASALQRPLSLANVAESVAKLLAFSEKLEGCKQLALYEGLRPAQAVLRSGKARAWANALVINRLLFVPLCWAYKDEGAAVRRVLERVQTACADRVASELLEDWTEVSGRPAASNGSWRQG